MLSQQPGGVFSSSKVAMNTATLNGSLARRFETIGARQAACSAPLRHPMQGLAQHKLSAFQRPQVW